MLERKIRLLTLASLAAQNVGRDLPYAEIATALQIDETKVEVWVIDGGSIARNSLLQLNLILLVIRAGLLSGKLSQSTQTLRVTRSTTRSFSRNEWETLEKRLATWKAGLLGVLDVVAAARAAAGKDVSAVLEAASAPIAQAA